MVKAISTYFFVAPDGKEYKVETLSIEQLKIHKDSLYQHVELTPERKREREVEELTQDIQRLLEIDTGRTVISVAKAVAKYVSDNFVKMG